MGGMGGRVLGFRGGLPLWGGQEVVVHVSTPASIPLFAFLQLQMKLAITYAMSQSTKLAVHEREVVEIVADTRCGCCTLYTRVTGKGIGLV